MKQLRESSGAGMMDCKKALAECGGDIEAAKEYLRKKGLASADKKAGRVAAEGMVWSYIHAGSRCGGSAAVGNVFFCSSEDLISARQPLSAGQGRCGVGAAGRWWAGWARKSGAHRMARVGRGAAWGGGVESRLQGGTWRVPAGWRWRQRRGTDYFGGEGEAKGEGRGLHLLGLLAVYIMHAVCALFKGPWVAAASSRQCWKACTRPSSKNHNWQGAGKVF